MPSETALTPGPSRWIFDIAIDDHHEFIGTIHVLVNSLRTWPPCVAVGPNASAAADEMEQGGYGREDAIANGTNFDMRHLV